ncbi:MAG: Short-chain dehydrogenase/reductase [Glaciihabitans sp.]|nr:Short-chain dehydrogenase/reductase [Glaciihabitans sp.]
MISRNNYNLAGKTVIVTGAGSGIGRAIARAFLEQGANVVVAARRLETLEETVEGFPPENWATVVADVGKRADVDALVDASITAFGSLDVFVNNAGTYVPGPIEDLADDEWRGMMSTNLDGFYYGVQAALPHLVTSHGNIVVISSVSGLRGDWGQAAYNATKGALNAMLQSLALDLGEKGIRVNGVAPAFTQTAVTAGMGSDEATLAPFINRIALGRPGQPEDIAPAVLFLASEDAHYITGAILPVDGGTSASTGQPHT